jgi:predicted NBD/HSP70 family sugar kinase
MPAVTPLPGSEAEFLRVLRDEAFASVDLAVGGGAGGAGGGLTQGELEQRVGLSRPSVVNLTKHVRPVLRDLPGEGTRATRVGLDPEAGVVFGVNIGHSAVQVAAADLFGRIFESTRPAEVHERRDAVGDADTVLDWIVATMEGCLAALGRSPEDVAGVGVCMAGPVDRERGILRPAAAVGDAAGGGESDWHLLSPREGLRRRLGWRGVPFLFDNDANACALGEHLWGAARAAPDGAPYRNVIRVEWSRGVGAGLILGGELYRGAGVAGELGHTVVVEGGPGCPRCGNAGCLDVIAGSDALVSRVAGAPSLEAAIALARGGDEAACAVFVEAAERTAQALGAMVSVLNPNLVVVGGTVGHAAYDLIRPPLLQALKRYTMRPALRDVEIARTTLPDWEELRGALALVLRAPAGDEDALLSYLARRAGAIRVAVRS